MELKKHTEGAETTHRLLLWLKYFLADKLNEIIRAKHKCSLKNATPTEIGSLAATFGNFLHMFDGGLWFSGTKLSTALYLCI